MVGATFGYQLSLGHPNNLYLDLQGGLWPAGVGLGNLVLKSVPSVANCSGLSGWAGN
jgi:hypothetical protein